MAWLQNRGFRYALLIGVVVAALYFLYLVREVVYSFLAAGILAYILYRPALWMERRGFQRVWAILLIYLILLIIIGSMLWFSIPGLMTELNHLAALLPEYQMRLEGVSRQFDGMQLPGRLNDITAQFAGRLEDNIYRALERMGASLYNLLGKAILIVFAPIMAFYIMRDWDHIKQVTANFFPPVTRRELGSLMVKIDTVIMEYGKGYLMISALVGLMIGTAAYSIGIPYPVLIGLIGGLGELVPFFGPFLGGIPAVGLALTHSLNDALYMLVALVVIQQVESNIITPRIIGERVGIHPLFLVFALLAGGKLMGFWGLLVAVPLAASLKIVGTHLYLKLVQS